MSSFTLAAPTPSDLGDHDVVREGSHLQGRRVALLVTGGIAAMKLPLVARALRRQGADVVAFASKDALRYVTAETLEWSTVHPVVTRLTAAAEHLSDSAPFDAYLMAPATYNSVNKLAAGIADGVVTAAAASALGRLAQGRTAVLVAPTMHGSLHNDILLSSLRRLHELGVRVIAPRDAYGKHNLPDEPVLVAEVARALSRSPLRGRRVLVTGGTAAVSLDEQHRIVHRSRGSLGAAIATELHLRGAEVTLLQSGEAAAVLPLLAQRVARTEAEYRALVREELSLGYAAVVLAAGTSGYEVGAAAAAERADGQGAVTCTLVPTANFLQELRAAYADVYLFPVHYQHSGSAEQLLAVDGEGLGRLPSDVWLGDQPVAAAVAEHLESVLLHIKRRDAR